MVKFIVFLPCILAGIVQGQNLVFTSGYSSQQKSFILDLEASGEINDFGSQDVDPNLTFIAVSPDSKSIYAIHEVEEYEGLGKTGALSRWLFGRDPFGKPIFKKIQSVSAMGTGTCHVQLDQENGMIHLSNYVGGSFASYKWDQVSGDILNLAYSEEYGLGSNVKPGRQEFSHAHGVWTFGPFVYLADLGSDKIWHYKVSADGNLAKADPAFTETPPGYGPRHMAIHADLMLAYVIFELESFIGVYSIDPETGALSEKFMVGIMAEPSEADYASEIEISPNQKQLYASNRGNGAILVYDILSDAGDLSQIQVQYVGGPMPRHFKVHPDGKFLLVALQESNKLELYQIDQDSGVLGPSQTIASDNNPTIVAYLYI